MMRDLDVFEGKVVLPCLLALNIYFGVSEHLKTPLGLRDGDSTEGCGFGLREKVGFLALHLF